MRQIPFSVVTKPTGAACNLDCTYCFFLSKELLYDEAGQRMTEEQLETYVREFLAGQPDGEVTMAWQGGEPTMRGLAFFRRAVELTKQYKRPGQQVLQTIQTNGTLLDDDWCAFLKEEGFLVGLSIDGPQHLHDEYRVNKAGRGTHAQVIRGWELLRKHAVEVNILCTVNAANQEHGAEVYRYFRDDLGATFLQFIPIVERAGYETADGKRLLYLQEGTQVTDRSVSPAVWGRFLSEVFDEWLKEDVGKVFVQHFDVMLAARFGQYSLCVHSPECGTALAVEHNNDVYSCDHYVEPGYKLGNLADGGFQKFLQLPEQREFGRSKRTSLTQQCLRCPVRWACHGGCPKDRFATSVDGEPGQNYLCEGYYTFFTHAAPVIEKMARAVASGRPAADYS
ncbi:MAG: anaerobic sulfatase maturase [Propionibacteriaceae bacterium]|nr:anaerobic sulfatase maturase [Propionibacteriaceae bacterium]